jgi:8-oxo-dGTP pyrophosphatase MutT (NUDIX family)
MDFAEYLFERKTPSKFTKDDVIRAAQDIGIDLSKYSYKEVMLGMQIESEHGSKWGNDVNVTGDQPQPTLKIVIAHLREHPHYYTQVLLPAEKRAIRESVEVLTNFDLYVNNVKDTKEATRIAAGILPICKETGRILLCKRADNVDNPGVWAGIGGGLESKKGESEENIIEVAKREFIEETTFKGYYSIIPSYIYITSNGGFKYYNFIGLFDHEFEPKLNEEHTEYKWFSLSDAEELPNEEIHFGIRLLFLNDPDIIKKYAM